MASLLKCRKMLKTFNKILVIRFSSLGDVTQSLSIVGFLKIRFPDCQVHFVTRHDFLDLVSSHPQVDQVHTLNPKAGILGLLQLCWKLKKENYSLIYDAHNSTRSKLISLLLRPPLAFDRIFSPPLLIRKTQKRWKRFLLFKFRINLFEMPFSGQRDLIEPLQKIHSDIRIPEAPQMLVIKKFDKELENAASSVGLDLSISGGPIVALAPSAAHLLKRWPIDYWKKLIQLSPTFRFVCLGGPQDHFIQEICDAGLPSQVFNLAGKTSIMATAAMIQKSKLLITNDTGPLHLAEQLGHPAFALMGPAPFGFPSRTTTQIFERNLSCRPCSKHGQGPCTNTEFQKCLRDITPEEVANRLHSFLGLSSKSQKETL